MDALMHDRSGSNLSRPGFGGVRAGSGRRGVCGMWGRGMKDALMHDMSVFSLSPLLFVGGGHGGSDLTTPPHLPLSS